MRLGFSQPKIESLDKYIANKEYKKALTAVASELKKNPAQFNLLLRQAEILGMAGNRDEAIAVYRDVAERYARDGFYAKAIALYKKVLKLNPELDEVHAQLARVIEEDRVSHLPISERLGLDDRSSQTGLLTSPEPERTADEADGDRDGPREQERKEREASRLFSAFKDEVLEEILSSTSLRSYDEGDIIVTEGEQGSSLYLLVTGEVKVFTRGEIGEHLPLAELGPGDFFGEVSLLTGKPRTATITAKTRVTAIELTKESVDRIAADHPEVHDVLEDFYQRRAQDTVEAVIRRMRDKEPATDRE